MNKILTTIAAALLVTAMLSSTAPAAQPQPPAPANSATTLAAELQVSVADLKSCGRDGKAPGEFNSQHEFTCAYIKMAILSLPLANPDKLAQFVKDWNPAKWANSDELQTTGVAEEERMARTFTLIRRMRDALGNPEPFDYVEEPKDSAAIATREQHPVLEGGIGAQLTLENMWQISQAVSASMPKGGLPGEEAQKRMEAAMVIGPGHRLVIESPVLNGPSWGILKDGDIIDEVNGTKLDGLSMGDAVKLIKGLAGTTVTLHILRANSQGVLVPIDLMLLRDKVQESAVSVHDVDGIRRLTVSNFSNDNLLSDFYQTLVEAKEQGVKGIIIDLRGNPGGRLDYVKAMLEMLVPRGEIVMSRTRDPGSTDVIQEQDIMDGASAIVETKLVGASDDTKDFQPYQRVEFTEQYALLAQHSPSYVDEHPLATVLDPDMPVVVLVNVHSYSASEIFAGGIQNTHRGLVIGQPTAGKNDIMAELQLPECATTNDPTHQCQPGGLAIIEGSFFPGGMNTDLTGVIPNQLVDQAADFGKTDAQMDAAVASINDQHNQLAARRAAADKSRKVNADRFRDEIAHRNANDAKAPKDQDPFLKE